MNAALFARVDALMAAKDGLGLTPEEARVLTLYHRMFVRAGARLEGAERARLKAILERLASLTTTFGQNVLADERDWELALAPADLDGLPPDLVAAMAEAAASRGRGGHLLTLSRSIVVPFLQLSPRRDLRETAFKAWVARGDNGGATDNRAIVAEILALRARAGAAPRLSRLRELQARAADGEDARGGARPPDGGVGAGAGAGRGGRREARRDDARRRRQRPARAVGLALLRGEARGGRARPRPGDAEAVPRARQRRRRAPSTSPGGCSASRFHPIEAELYHPDARVWEVRRGDRHMGLFVGDYFARPSKRSGAWCTTFRDQRKLDGEVRPIAVNVCNFAKASAGEPNLLTFDDAHTLFHEMGHALHVLLSDVTYDFISGTSVARDFVELPSQLYEHWLETPEVLEAHARHAVTGAPMPRDLMDRLIAARNFDMGFATVEYLSSALVDLDFHVGAPPADPMAAQAATLSRIGMPEAIVMRHATPHFQHVFAGDGYSAGYYSYMWSEVMDADAFAAFRETGNVFDPATAARLAGAILGAGGSRDEAELYRAFRGRMPGVEALLAQRGLDAA